MVIIIIGVTFLDSLRHKVMDFLEMNWFKLLIVVLMVTGSLIVKYGELTQRADVPQPVDYPQNWTLGMNKFAEENPLFRDVWIAFSTFLLDLQFFIVMVNWIRRGFSMRTPFTIALFYGIRAVLQQLYILPFPEHIYWESPGFP